MFYIHKERIDVLQQQGDVFKKAQTNFGHDPETFTSIETLLTTEQPNRYDLLARGKLARTNQNFIYPCCAKCHRLTTAAYGRLFECHSCHEIKNAIPRFRFSLLVYDESSEIEVTIFGDEGEKIMQMSANDFMNKYCNDEPLILDSINSNLHQLHLRMKIQSKVFNKQDGTTTMSHTMQTLECHQLASSATPRNKILSSSPADTANVLELSASQKTETTSLNQQQKHILPR
ncbi:Replication factor A protein 1 [Orobanche hederae]